MYFHNRDVENGGESDHINVREQVGADLEYEFLGPTPWKKSSEFEPQAGENETVEEFLEAVYNDLFYQKNRRYVTDNLSREERGSLREFMRWNRDRNNPRVIRVEDKGSSFVVDWKTNCFERCDEYIGDATTFRSDDRDMSAEHAVEVKCWAEKWENNEVLSSEEANWVRIDNPKPARLYANIKIHKNGWPFRFILSARGSAAENLARWVECQLRVIATKHKAYIKDTKSFLLYLEDLIMNRENAPFRPHARMISWDIVSFYPNCDMGLFLQAVRRALDRWEPKMSEERKQCICEAVSITMNFYSIKWSYHRRAGLCKHNRHIWGRIYRPSSAEWI